MGRIRREPIPSIELTHPIGKGPPSGNHHKGPFARQLPQRQANPIQGAGNPAEPAADLDDRDV
jgi:hypothetical protein